jgi:NAD(P)-dependent dehydrogenase (short-subunit alcohol dehydrogenase family)
MQSVLPGSVVLVTGGSRGIGAAVVRALHAGGAAVYFTYRSATVAAAELAAELGGERVAAAACDLEQPGALEALIDGCVARFGRIDTLVNNAAISLDNPFDGDDFDAWRAGWAKTFAVNLFAAADLSWLALRRMRGNAPGLQGVRGRIVNVASRAAHRGELTFADYGASKAALVNLSKSLARGCARDGIVAFSVAPGFIETDMAADSLARHGEHIRGEIPSGRVGTPDEVASIVAFLASGAADYASGTTIDVNGASYVR